MMPAALLAPFAAAFVALALGSAAAVGLAGSLAHRFAPAGRAPSTAPRAAVLLAPFVLAALGCAALAFPDPYAACHCAAHGLHHPHLCVAHPGFAVPLVVPAAWLVAVWLAAAAPRALRVAREAVASARWARDARRLPVASIGGVAVRLADCGARTAFAVGVLRPFIVVDRQLWRSLTDEARRAVVYHEEGHVLRRDGLTLLAARACAAVFPMPAGARLLAAWRSAAERACDLHAAARLGDTAAVAAALVAVEKLRAEGAPARALALGIGHGGELERRVLALLDARGGRPVASPLGSDLLAVAIVALGVALLSIAWPGGAFHHAIETLIGHLVR